MNAETAHAEVKYRGETAANYDAKRVGTAKWQTENRIIDAMLSAYPSGTYVLDVPTGTGRLIPAYEERGFNVLGLDINEDMLKEARKKITTDRVRVRVGTIIAIDRPSKSVDIALAIRLLNWLDPEDVQKAIRELQRVARKAVIFTCRVADHVRARPMGLINAAIDRDAGWVMANAEEIEPNYLMFRLVRG